MSTETTSKSVIQRVSVKGCNITLIADGLYSSLVGPKSFPELGEPRYNMQVPQIGVLDFGKYNLVIQVDEKRVLAADISGEMNASSPIPAMIRKCLQEGKELKVSALGFNFIFEAALDVPLVDFLQETYVHKESATRFGDSYASLGFKFSMVQLNHLMTLAVEPIWQNPKTTLATVNFHFDRPGAEMTEELVQIYGKFVSVAPELIEKLFSR
jgi:hypothetical protein